MAGATDLDAMLATLRVSRRAATYTIVDLGEPSEQPTIGDGIEALINEGEGLTVVCTVEVARAENWPIEFEAAWLTLDVHSALEAVGLTAAFSAVLGEAAIPCNVLAGFYHDHLLVPAERAAEAIECLEGLRSR